MDSGIDLLNSNPGLFNAVINYPAVCLPLLDTAFVEIMTDLEKLSQDDDILIAKANAHVRISNLPQVPAYFRTSIPTSDDVGKLVSVTATVTRSGPVNMVVEMRMYECPKCHGTFPVRADVDRNCQIVPPVVCMANEIPGCKATKFKLIPDDQAHQATMPLRSYQEIKIQEQVNKLSLGTISFSFY
ncbi:DNA helicase mcm9 [Entomophthora muscae]|uniref:DNA helicase mcm9 n=1 Tax=Entomophthora muscae TaxID=34485 RepID=A0ACC2RDP1_9FUNG|nr:DNA helicase mcm9 [Entomophthora muscae]